MPRNPSLLLPLLLLMASGGGARGSRRKGEHVEELMKKYYSRKIWALPLKSKLLNNQRTIDKRSGSKW